MRRGFRAGLFALIGLAILFSMPSFGDGANWGNPQLQIYGTTPIQNGDRVVLVGSGFEPGEILTGFGVVAQIHNEEPNIYRGFNLPDLRTTANALGEFRVEIPLEMLSGIKGHIELALYRNGQIITSQFLPVEDHGMYHSAAVDATAGTLYFDSFAHGGIGEPPVVNDDDVPLTSSAAADWDGSLFQVNLERYTTTNGTGTSDPYNALTNDVTFTGTSPNLDLTPGSSAIVAGLSTTYKTVRMTVLVWDSGNYATIVGTTTEGATQGQGWLSSTDETAPEVSSAEAISLTQIVVTFSENVTTPSLNADAIDNWTVTFGVTKAVSALTPLGSSSTATCTLTVADLGDYGATPTVQFTTGTDEFEDSWGNDCASTVSPHITASDGIAPPAPTLDAPTGSTIMTGASVTWSATPGTGTDNSLAGIKLQGSDNGTDWGDLDDDTSSPYGGTYTFGTKYTYYRALAYDTNSNSTGSSSTENLQDAYFLDLTTIPASTAVNVESGQWEVTVKDNYGNAETVTETIGLSTESSGGRFRETSGGSSVGSIDLVSASTGNFYYIDSQVGTWKIKVTNVSLQPDSTDYQITAGTASKILIKLPGQAFTSGTGITGTPDFSSYGGDLRWAKAGTGFPVVLYTVDSGNNLVYETGTRDIDFTTTAGAAPDGTNPTINANTFPVSNLSVSFTDGESTTSLTMICYDFTDDYTNVSLTASDDSGSPTLTGVVSTGFLVLFASADHLDWTDSGGSVTALPIGSSQTAGAALPTLYISALDQYDNRDTTYTGSTITTLAGSANPPTNSPSGTGQGGANAPSGNSAPDYGTNSTWSAGTVTLLSSDVDQRTVIYAATSTGFRIRALASGGTLDGLYTPNSDLFTVDAATANYLRIEDTSGGGGTEYVDGESFTTDQSITFWAIAYDIYGNTSGNYVADWSSTNLTPAASGTSTNWTFNPSTTTTGGTLTASNGSVTDRTISSITVTAGQTISYIMIRTATGGGGSETGAFEIGGAANGGTYNVSDYMYAAAYNADDIYINDVAATWAITDITGGSFENTVAATSNRYTASSTTNQTGYIYITYNTKTDSTGLVTVDATKPATVQSFNIEEYATDRNYVWATWDETSSYDDGSSAASGNVADFDIRFSSTIIENETDWDNATTVGTQGKPSSFNGSNSWLIYMGGNTAGYYYYAIKTKDDQGYWSDMGSGCYTTSPDYSLPVELSAFTAKGTFAKIIVSWSTESEVDALGFRLYRDVSEDFDDPIQVSSYETNPDLLCQGSSATGFDYKFIDQDEIDPKTTYYYQLEAVDINGRSETAELQASAEALPLPTEVALGPNFPNPFNPETRFELKLPENGNVTVVIYNARGQQVARLVDDHYYEAGIHQLSWNGTNDQGAPVPSGIYFARLKTDHAQRIMKMLLLK